jgi:hypothetical protein
MLPARPHEEANLSPAIKLARRINVAYGVVYGVAYGVVFGEKRWRAR